MTAKVILKAKRAQPFFGRHPWVFPGALDRIEGEPENLAFFTLEQDRRSVHPAEPSLEVAAPFERRAHAR